MQLERSICTVNDALFTVAQNHTHKTVGIAVVLARNCYTSNIHNVFSYYIFLIVYYIFFNYIFFSLPNALVATSHVTAPYKLSLYYYYYY